MTHQSDISGTPPHPARPAPTTPSSDGGSHPHSLCPLRLLPPLPQRPLGSTGINVSILGLGTVTLGRVLGVKYPHPVTLPTDGQAQDLLHVAHAAGMNLIDTAPAYGTSEERLGLLLCGQRDRWIISTKFGESFENGQSTFDFSPPAIVASIERSLVRLRTTYIDIALLHSDGLVEADLITPGIIDTLDRLVARGLLRTFGASTKTLAGSLHALLHCPVVMLTYNPSATTEAPALDRAHHKRRGVLIKKAFSSGHLLTPDPSNPGPSNSGPSNSGPSNSGPSAFLHFALAPPAVASVIVGTTNLIHLRANIAAAHAAQALITPLIL